MIEFVFAPDDVARVRFAFSPLWELVRSLRVLADPSGHALHLPWVHAVRPRLRGLDLGPLGAVVRPSGYIPDFLTPPPATPLPDLDAELETVGDTPLDVVAAELRQVEHRSRPTPAWHAMVDDPERALDVLVESLERYWVAAVEPYWTRVRDLLEGDVLRRTAALAAQGAAGVFGDLHEAVSWGSGTLRVDRRWTFHGGLDGQGLLLVPSVFVWPNVSVMVPPYQAMLSYPPTGVATLWETGRPPADRRDALAALIGRRRAALLVALATPASTGELARRMGVTPGAVSQHIGVLRACGLVTGHRLGRRVLYVRTAAGDALMGPSAQ
ncbi:helix-turn-helix protein [Actinomadura pelletieri DSM 43383]|uniref:Helix-turn-helix protein n=1 Tax=Actinomadura pelletieri DSM 43383 TaxID=1120940 RepID=A0A495QP08_9ACTN|nr:winged helix-turn-helix domain-containing protein [Actinomadura pelletieri]RKS74708.1 helix-turn-helix protein [Actinomadura pelletieri DSM 43383]